MQNRVFFPQAVLDLWLSEDSVDLDGTALTLRSEGRKFKLTEALHVTREVTGDADANELVGRVKSRAYLLELGAEIMEHSLLLGDNAYDVVPGWLATPVGGLREFLSRRERAAPQSGTARFGDEPKTDEDLLARFVLSHLETRGGP